MDNNQYYLELPSLYYNQENLIDLVEGLKDQWTLYWLPEWEDLEFDRSQQNFDISVENHQYDPIKQIIQQLPEEIRDTCNCKLKKFPANFVHSLHKDNEELPIEKARKSFIHIPISKNASAINFYNDDKKLICKLEYKMATLVNTQIYHIIDTPSTDRISLQITLPPNYDWNQIKKIIQQRL